jgi:thiamine-phosphate pyrophosphorylase
VPVPEVRRLLGPDAIIGVSTHSAGEAIVAERDGADFVTNGPVYRTPSKAGYGPPAGIGVLSDTAAMVGIPVFALGGIKPGNIEEVMRAGASGTAVISAVMAAEDTAESTSRLISRLGAYK